MGTRSKSFSHSIFTKFVVFVIVILCFIGVIKQIVEIEAVNNSDLGIVFEEDYFHSESYIRESIDIIGNLNRLIGEFKNEEHILAGGTINEHELRNEENELYDDFQFNSKSFNPQLSEGENYEKFKQEYAEKIALAREKLIKDDLREYHSILEVLKEYKNPLYYVNDGVNMYTNTKKVVKEQFKSNPSYLLFEEYNSEIYPKEVKENEKLNWITEGLDELNSENTVVYIAYTDSFFR